MELTTQYMESIKTLQEKKKTYAPLMELRTQSMKKQIKKSNYPIQSSYDSLSLWMVEDKSYGNLNP